MKNELVKKNKPNHSNKPVIDIWCDGGCRNNGSSYNVGAYAYKIIKGSEIFVWGKAEKGTTNNKMELMSVIEALRDLHDNEKVDCQIHIFSDSQYVVKGLNEWWWGWVEKGFRNVKNLDLWITLRKLWDSIETKKITWVKGHAGNIHNEEVDRYCNKLMDRLK